MQKFGCLYLHCTTVEKYGFSVKALVTVGPGPLINEIPFASGCGASGVEIAVLNEDAILSVTDDRPSTPPRSSSTTMSDPELWIVGTTHLAFALT